MEWFDWRWIAEAILTLEVGYYSSHEKTTFFGPCQGVVDQTLGHRAPGAVMGADEEDPFHAHHLPLFSAAGTGNPIFAGAGCQFQALWISYLKPETRN